MVLFEKLVTIKDRDEPGLLDTKNKKQKPFILVLVIDSRRTQMLVSAEIFQYMLAIICIISGTILPLLNFQFFKIFRIFCTLLVNWNGTMQNRFLNLDNFLIFLAYDDLMVGISDGTNCF